MKGASELERRKTINSISFGTSCRILPTPLIRAAIPKKSPLFPMKNSANFTALFIILALSFLFYGNLPLAKHLDFIDEHALANVSKSFDASPLPLQKTFYGAMACDGIYPIGAHGRAGKKNHYRSRLFDSSNLPSNDLLALSLLDSLPHDTDVSPLKFALLQSKLCTSVESHFDTEMSERPGCSSAKAAMKKSTRQNCASHSIGIGKLCFYRNLIQRRSKHRWHQLEFDRTEIGEIACPLD